MTASDAKPSPALSGTRIKPFAAAEYFYPATACLLLVITIYGFKNFFFHGKAFHGGPLNPAIKTLLIVHGIAMLAWILLFIIQPTLIAMRKHKLHRKLGTFGAILALALTVMGIFVAIHANQQMPPDMLLYGLTPTQFFYIPFTSIVVFGVLVGLAVWMRKTPAAHRSLMLVATLSALSAAMGRIPWLIDPFVGTLWFRLLGVMHTSVLLGVVLMAIRSALIKRLDGWLALTVAATAALYAIMLPVAKTAAWASFTHLLVG